MPRIGITGHMNLTPATEKLVTAALYELLTLYESTNLVGVNCLARSADQLFARIVHDLDRLPRYLLRQ